MHFNEPTPVQVQGLPTAVRVVTGYYHACAKTLGGRVYCWGANSYGQLGNPSASGHSTTPVPVLMADSSPLGNVAGLVAGARFTCARQYSGQMLCWGANGVGQLGIGSTTDQPSPTVVPGLTAQAITAGANHACALPYVGGVECWGYNASGQLGDGTTTDAHSPVAVSGLSGVPIEIAAGSQFTCARLAGGTVDCWGANGDGQLGDGSRADRHVPDPVDGLSDIQALTASGMFACALQQGDDVATCWGDNASGQLGDGILPYRTQPAVVPGLASVESVSVGSGYTCMVDLTDNGRCWGSNFKGKLGDGTLVASLSPQLVSGGPIWGKIAAGSSATCGIDTTNTVWCWGNNSSGQLGIGSTDPYKTTPQKLSSLGPVQDVSLSYGHACAVKLGGWVYCWGTNQRGQLGDNKASGSQSNVPVQVHNLAAGASGVVTGRGFSCALKTDQTVWCWGWNFSGQLGDNQNSGNESDLPVQVHGLSGVIALAASGRHVCAIKNGSPHNTIWCWGGNTAGQLGDGTTTPKLEPVQVQAAGTGLTDPTAIAAGDMHSCALDAGGSVYCWGANNRGQLGAGSTAPQLVPTAVNNLHNALAIAAGGQETCAVRSDHKLVCWGDNSSGQLGSNPAGYSAHILQPVQQFRSRIFAGHFDGSY